MDVFTCGVCGATRLHAPPHGSGNPCPLRLEEHAARLRQLEPSPSGVKVTLPTGETWHLPIGDEYAFDGTSFYKAVCLDRRVPE